MCLPLIWSLALPLQPEKDGVANEVIPRWTPHPSPQTLWQSLQAVIHPNSLSELMRLPCPGSTGAGEISKMTCAEHAGDPITVPCSHQLPGPRPHPSPTVILGFVLAPSLEPSTGKQIEMSCDPTSEANPLGGATLVFLFPDATMP